MTHREEDLPRLDRALSDENQEGRRTIPLQEKSSDQAWNAVELHLPCLITLLAPVSAEHHGITPKTNRQNLTLSANARPSMPSPGSETTHQQRQHSLQSLATYQAVQPQPDYLADGQAVRDLIAEELDL